MQEYKFCTRRKHFYVPQDVSQEQGSSPSKKLSTVHRLCRTQGLAAGAVPRASLLAQQNSRHQLESEDYLCLLALICF